MKTEETAHVFFFDDANQRYYIVGLSDFLDPRPGEEDTPKESPPSWESPFTASAGRVTELKEMGVVRPTKDLRAGRAVELTPESRPAAQSCPEKQSQPGRAS